METKTEIEGITLTTDFTQEDIDYSIKTMLGTLYYKCIGGISSMQEMTPQFNNEKVVENLY